MLPTAAALLLAQLAQYAQSFPQRCRWVESPPHIICEVSDAQLDTEAGAHNGCCRSQPGFRKTHGYPRWRRA